MTHIDIMAGLGTPYEVVDGKLSAGRGEEFSAAAIVSLPTSRNRGMPLRLRIFENFEVTEWLHLGACRERSGSRNI